MANLGPSEELLKAFQSGRLTWAAFRTQYRRELLEADSTDTRNRTIKNRGQKFTLRLLQALGRKERVTLLCHCGEDEPYCHRRILHSVLSSKI